MLGGLRVTPRDVAHPGGAQHTHRAQKSSPPLSGRAHGGRHPDVTSPPDTYLHLAFDRAVHAAADPQLAEPERRSAAIVVRALALALTSPGEYRVTSLLAAVERTFALPEVCAPLVDAACELHPPLGTLEVEAAGAVGLSRLAGRAFRADAASPLCRLVRHLLRSSPERVPAEWVRRCLELGAPPRPWDSLELLTRWLRTGPAELEWARAFLRANPELLLGARLRAVDGLHQLVPLAETWGYLARIAGRFGSRGARDPVGHRVLQPGAYAGQLTEAVETLSAAAAVETDAAAAEVLARWENELRTRIATMDRSPHDGRERSPR